MKNFNEKKRAFTLAEIMITLTILGIVAAIVIPNTVRNYEKTQIPVRFKIAYSILSNAVEASAIDNGPPENWAPKIENIYTKPSDALCESYGLANKCSMDAVTRVSSKAFAEQYLLPYLKIQYECSDRNKCFNDRFNDKNKNNDKIFGADGKPAYTYIQYDSRGYAFRLKNGMSVLVNRYNHKNITDTLITVDINGPKGYSVAGRDVFVFHFTNKGLKPGALDDNEYWYFQSPWKGGNCTKDGLSSGSEFVGMSGTNCGKWLLKNNFRFTSKEYYDIDALLRCAPPNNISSCPK